nr:PREDICTED: mitotic spindle assembly checkpoint protein MAD2B [Bos mutus]
MGLFTVPRNPNFSAIFIPFPLCTPQIMYGANLKQEREDFSMRAIPFLRLLLVASLKAEDTPASSARGSGSLSSFFKRRQTGILSPRDHPETQRQRDKETGFHREKASAEEESGREMSPGERGEDAREAVSERGKVGARRKPTFVRARNQAVKWDGRNARYEEGGTAHRGAFAASEMVSDVLCEFLEVAVHLILYVREVYPVGIFQKRKKYNVPVQMSCHPELNQYIQDTLHCVKPLLEKNDVEKVVVVILDKEHRPVEKFVFEITQPPLLSISSDSLLSHVEQLLRAFILKISVCDAVLDHNPPGCTFTVLVHTREAATRNMEKIQVIKDFPWILADEQDVHMHDPRLIPLKTMTSDILKMQLYVEERAHKSS